MIQFQILHPKMDFRDLGLLPTFLDPRDSRPAAEQLNSNYAHGGGWSPYGQGEWKLLRRSEGQPAIVWPGESEDEVESFEPLAVARLRDELILVYRYALVAIVQPTDEFEVSRLD